MRPNVTASPHLDHQNSTKAVTGETGEVVVQYVYRAFGEQLRRYWEGDPNKTTGDEMTDATYTYGGKELDDDTNLYYFNARYYDATTGRFINVDPIQDGSNWYVYCRNNPMNFVDPTGLEPGDIFQTVNDAAIDFGNTYNDDSIRNNREYGSSVYYDPLGKGYTYSTPARGTSDYVIRSVDQINQTVAQLHTHAAYVKGIVNNDFSGADRRLADKAGVPSYVATPNGSLLVYDPITKQTSSVRTDLPSDRNDPTRLNQNDPKNGVDDNSRAQSQIQSVLDIIVNTVFGNNKESELKGRSE